MITNKIIISFEKTFSNIENKCISTTNLNTNAVGCE